MPFLPHQFPDSIFQLSQFISQNNNNHLKIKSIYLIK